MMRIRGPIPLLAMAFCLFLLQNRLMAQEKSKVQFGKVSPEDFKVASSVPVDSNTNAVILADIGSVHFIGNQKGWFSYVYKRHTRIKILNKKAFALASQEIQLYEKDQDPEKADNVLASTYNLEHGVVVETKLDKKDIFDSREDKFHNVKKWTLPAVKEGSIIEYTYTITSDYNFNLPSWEFQSLEYPCAWSEYEVAIPQTLFYVFVRQGVHGYAVDKGSESTESYKIKENDDARTLSVENRDIFLTAVTIKHRWAMKDVPAFRVENYLTTPMNYMDKISFQLEKTYNGEDTHEVMNSWKKANEELLKQDDFGQPLAEENEWLDDLLGRITKGAQDRLQMAKAVYYYMSSHFTCTNHYQKYIRTSLRDVVKNNSGTVGDLNLLLIAMLRRLNIQTDPVLLSTREYGINLVKYPVMDKLNYVIARARIDGKIFYLDAAHPRLGFGQLAGNCYNGHARIISERDSGSVYFEADSLKEMKSTMVFLSNGPKGLEGTYQSVAGPQESYNIREQVSERGKKEYFKRIQTSYGEDVEISEADIDSLDRLEDPVKTHYEFVIRQQGADASIIYFNPLFGDAWRENPFKAAERKYPVEMPYVIDELYVMNLEIPAGYVVDEIPKSARVAFNGDQGMFEYLIAKQEGLIQLRCRIRLTRANFPPDDYSSLRDFFGFVVKKEAEQIVLKKQ